MRNRTIFENITDALLDVCKLHPHVAHADVVGRNSEYARGTETVIAINCKPCDSDTLYFHNTILTILASSCAKKNCDDTNTHEKGLRLCDQEHRINSDLVNSGNTDNSELWEVLVNSLEGIMLTCPHSSLTCQQLCWIQKWLKQGALNNWCTADCGPSPFSFEASIATVLDQAFQSCHGANICDGLLVLNNYSENACF